MENEHFVGGQEHFATIEGYVETAVGGMHLANNQRVLVSTTSDVQLCAIGLTSTLHGAVRQIACGRHPHQLAVGCVGEHLVVVVAMLVTCMRHVTTSVGGYNLDATERKIKSKHCLVWVLPSRGLCRQHARHDQRRSARR